MAVGNQAQDGEGGGGWGEEKTGGARLRIERKACLRIGVCACVCTNVREEEGLLLVRCGW